MSYHRITSNPEVRYLCQLEAVLGAIEAAVRRNGSRKVSILGTDYDDMSYQDFKEHLAGLKQAGIIEKCKISETRLHGTFDQCALVVNEKKLRAAKKKVEKDLQKISRSNVGMFQRLADFLNELLQPLRPALKILDIIGSAIAIITLALARLRSRH